MINSLIAEYPKSFTFSDNKILRLAEHFLKKEGDQMHDL